MFVSRRQTSHSADVLGERGVRVRSKQVDTLLEIHRIRIREMLDERRGDRMQRGEALRVFDDRVRVLRRPVEISPPVPIINNGARIVSKLTCFDVRARICGHEFIVTAMQKQDAELSTVNSMTDQPQTGDREVVIYDLDGVITAKDTFSALIGAQLRRAPIRLLRALPVVALMLLGRRAGSRGAAARKVTEIALTGMSEKEYNELAVAFGSRVGGDSRWIRASTVERMRDQRDAGVRIIIATATEHRLAEALLARAEVPYEVLSASLLEATATGMRIADHRVSGRKLEALRELGIPVEHAEFVTDSLTDLPTARAAARVTLIGASLATRKRYERLGLISRSEQ